MLTRKSNWVCTALILLLVCMLTSSCRNSTAKVDAVSWVTGPVGNQQVCFLVTVSGLPPGDSTYVSLLLSVGASHNASFQTYVLANGSYQICLPLPGPDATTPAYSFTLFVADKSKTKPYPRPGGDPYGQAGKDWDKHVDKDWDKFSIPPQPNPPATIPPLTPTPAPI
jgi:hypothetical protein